MTKKKKTANFTFRNYVCYLLVGAMLLLALVLQSAGSLPMSMANLFVQIAYSIILAVSLNLVVGFLGELSLGHAGFMCIGAYLGSYIAMLLRQSIDSKLLVLLISMLIGGLVAALFGFIVGLPALRLKGDYLAIVTLAFGEIVRTVCKNLPVFGGAMGLSTKDIKYDSRKDTSLYIVVFIVALVVLFLIQNLVRSKHGRAITAIRDNEIAAKAMGINVTFYKLFVFVIAAFFAGIAGVVYGHFTTPVLYSFFSYNYSIEILVMVVLGGMASVNGSIIAATLITIINFELQKKLSGDLAALKFLIYAVILIVLVIFNNAPKLAPLKEKLSPKAVFARLLSKRRHVDSELDKPVDWKNIPSKISMNEVLSVDLQQDKNYTPDKPDKPDKGGNSHE